LVRNEKEILAILASPKGVKIILVSLLVALAVRSRKEFLFLGS